MKLLLSPLRNFLFGKATRTVVIIAAAVSAVFSVLVAQVHPAHPSPAGITAVCATPPAGMVSWWPGENNGHDIVSHYNLALGGAGFATGEVGTAFSFNGSQFATPGDVAGLNFAGTTNVSVDGWINPAADGGHGILFGKAVSGQSEYRVYINGGEVIGTVDTGIEHEVHSGYNAPANTWTHVALTYDGSTLAIYINGSPANTAAVSGTLVDCGSCNPSQRSFTIGGRDDGFDFTGLIDEVEVFNTTVSATDISNIYSAGSLGKCRTCYTPPADMVRWWPGDGNTKDIQGGNNGLLKNGATFGPGEVGKAFSLNGSQNQYVDVGVISFPSAFSFDAWINPTETGSNPLVFSNYDGVNGFIVQIVGGQVYAYASSGGGKTVYKTSSVITNNTWQHLAVIFDGSSGQKFIIYVNGTAVPTSIDEEDGVNSIPDSSVPASIGFGHYFAGPGWTGLIDEVEVFSRKLNPGEIQSIYDAGTLGKCKPTCVTPPSGLIAWWPGDNTATDIQGGHNGTLKNGATFANGEVDRAFNFDGTDDYVTVPHTASLDPNPSFSVDFWVFRRGVISGNFEGLVVQSQNELGGEPDSYGIFTDESAQDLFIVIGGATFLTNTGNVPLNQWFHVALTYEDSTGTAKVYINGEIDTLVDGLTRSVSSGPLIFGTRSGQALYFNGLLDEIEVFNHELTVDEVKAIYNAGSAGKCKTARIYVADNDNVTIEKFDINGVDLGAFADASSGFSIPHGLAFDASGNLFVGDVSLNQVFKFDPLGHPTTFADSSAGLAAPYGMAFDASGNLFVANPGFNSILKFQPNGSVTTFANSGVNSPSDVVFDRDGNLYAVNDGNGTVEKFTSGGADQGVFASAPLQSPLGARFDSSGQLYVSDFAHSYIEKFDSNGNDLGAFANVGSNSFYGIEFDPFGNLYGAQAAGNIYKFDQNGNATLFTNYPHVNRPTFIAVQLFSPTAASIQFNKPSYSVNEPAGTITLTVTRDGDLSGSSTVHYATADGTGGSPAVAGDDYTETHGILNFGPYETTMPVQVPITVDDDSDPGSEPPSKEFTVTLSNATDAMLSGPATATVTIIDIHHDVTTGVYQDAGGGTVSGGGTFDQGSTVTLTATPDSCHKFADWVDGDGNFLSSDNPYSFTVNGDVSVFAVFSPISYNISASVSPSGSGSISGAGSHDCGTEVDLTATPNDCYTFTNWTEGNSVASTDNPYVFTVDSDRTLVANFTIKAACAGACATLSPTIYDVSSEFTTGADRAAVHCIDGSGLDSADPPNHTSNPNGFMWLNNGDGNFSAGASDPDRPGQLAHITFNLGGTVAVSSFRVWNYNEFGGGHNFNNRGVKDLTISVSTDGSNFTPLTNPGTNTTTWTFAQAPGSSSYTGQLITFTVPVTAAYIRFDIKSNFGPDPSDGVDHGLVGLSEVRFEACPVTCVPPPANMIAWWRGDGNANDSIGGHDGSLMSGATFAAGIVGQAFSFGGGSETVSVPDSPAWDFGANDFTIDTWVFLNADHAGNAFVTHENNDASRWLFWTDVDNLEFFIQDGANVANPSVPFTPPIGEWFHVAVTRTGGDTYKFYVNGVQVGSDVTNSMSIPAVQAPLTIGKSQSDISLSGLLDEVEIFNRALSADEIAGIVRAGGMGKCECTPPPGGMVSWWPGEKDGSDIQDNNDATLNNITFAAGEVGQAFVFNGSTSDINVLASSNLNVGTGNGMTIDMWINPDPAAITNTVSPILTEWNAGSGGDAAIGTGLILDRDNGNNLSAGALEFEIIDTTGNGCALGTGPGVIAAGQWQHVAATYDKTSGIAVLYVNGQNVGSINCGTHTLQTSFPLDFGIRRAGSGGARYTGAMDEMEVFDHALSQSEIQAIYHAGSAGKCRSCTPAPSGMIDWWPGDGNANDITGGYSGTLKNGATFAPGEVGQAFSLNGSNKQYVDIGDVDLPATFTIDTWINPASLSGANYLITKDDGNTTSYAFQVQADGTLIGIVQSASGLTFYQTNPGVVTTGTWQHVALTYDGNAPALQKFTFYVNGVVAPASLNGSNDAGGTPANNAASATIGIFSNGSSFPFNGLIDEFEIFNRVLSATEVQAIYDAGSGGKCKPATAPDRQLFNISTRAEVGTGDNVAIGGFIVRTDPSGTAAAKTRAVPNTKQVLIRGIGPSLAASNVPNPLQNPVLELHDNNGAIMTSNDNWGDAPNASDIQATGLAPSDPLESAILITLNADASYTAILSGKNNTTGIGLVEVYDMDVLGNTHLVNISTRGFVDTGDNVLIGGLIVKGGTPARVVVRAMGPSMTVLGADALPDPFLELHDTNGALIASNDDWVSSPDAAAITTAGLNPTNSKESAILFTPAPGAYTAIVRGNGPTPTGVGLVEAYRLKN